MERSYFHSYQPQAALQALGPDAKPFLQGQFSNDLGRTAAGDCVYGLWLDRKGKVLADSFALCRSEEAYLLLSYYCPSAAVRDRLEAYLIMDEVELLEGPAEFAGFSLGGEACRLGLEAAGLEQPVAGAWSEAGAALAFWGRRGTEPALEILVDVASEEGRRCLAAVERSLREACIPELDATAMKELSIRGAVPRVGLEFGPRDLPQEIGLESVAVSYSKGCYLGQEVMARIHSMGRVRKQLARVRIDSLDTVGELPAELLDDSGKRCGELRATAATGDGGIGLGVVSLASRKGSFRAGESRVVLDTGAGVDE